ncbi:MAG: gamma-glutamyltransferase family protein [Pseudomonadota bacterium]
MDRRRALAAITTAFLAACGDPATDTAAVDTPIDVMPAVDDVDPLPWIVSAAHPLAVEAGADVLARGGTAADAAVAIQAVLSLVEPHASGLAGGAFMLFFDAETGELHAYDGREMAPASTTPDIFLKEDGSAMAFFEAVRSGYSTGVPGAVALLAFAHQRHGQLEWSSLFDAPIRLASDGFPMPQRLHDWAGRLPHLRLEDGGAIYYNEDGQALAVGETVTNQAFADSVTMIAEGGAPAFYSGPIAEAIIARVNSQSGEETMALDDFASYQVIERDPICRPVKTFNICSMPPPSSGGVTLLQIMQIYEQTGAEGAPQDNLVPYVEATRLAYADRNRYLGDPMSMGTDDLTAQDLTKALIDPAYLKDRAALIGTAPLQAVEPGTPAGPALKEGRLDDQSYEVPATSHFSIRDSDGNIISMTATVEMPFGSQMFAGGMVLNNQLTDFSRDPGRDGKPIANAPGPRKRPMSSMTPVVVFDDDGEPYAATGSPGGPAIISYVAKTLMAHVFGGDKISDAILRPHVVVPRGKVLVEEGGEDIATKLGAAGYEISTAPLTSGLHGFVLNPDDVDTFADHRREGSVITAHDWQ